MYSIILPVAAFLSVVALFAAIAVFVRGMKPTSTEDRLEVLVGKKSVESESKGIMKDDLAQGGFTPLIQMLGGISKKFQNLGLFFEQADSPLRADAVFGVGIGSALLSVALAWVTGAPTPLYPVAALAGGSVPFFWLMFRRKTRFRQFERQLPDALELVARALRSGHSLASGLHVVVHEMPAPVSSEFSRAYEEQNLGVPIDKALKNMLKRMPNMDLKFFVTAVAVQRQAGGDMAEILDKIGYIIRERFKIMGTVKALTGEGRMSGVVLMALPIALFIAVYFLNPDYVMLLFTEELGRKMIFAAAVLQVFGAVAIKRIINIKI